MLVTCLVNFGPIHTWETGLDERKVKIRGGEVALEKIRRKRVAVVRLRRYAETLLGAVDEPVCTHQPRHLLAAQLGVSLAKSTRDAWAAVAAMASFELGPNVLSKNRVDQRALRRPVRATLVETRARHIEKLAHSFGLIVRCLSRRAQWTFLDFLLLSENRHSRHSRASSSSFVSPRRFCAA